MDSEKLEPPKPKVKDTADPTQNANPNPTTLSTLRGASQKLTNQNQDQPGAKGKKEEPNSNRPRPQSATQTGVRGQIPAGPPAVQGGGTLKRHSVPDAAFVVIVPHSFGPSLSYERRVLLGLILLILDFGTDVAFAGYNIFAGRYELAFVSLFMISLPMLFHYNSHVYNTQEGLIRQREAFGGRSTLWDRELWGVDILATLLVDPIVWAYNHYLYTIEYRDGPDDKKETKRKKFYFTKQMAQLSFKNEARLEATWQSKVTLIGFLFYYKEFWLFTKICIFTSLTFSVISMARANCTNMLKSQKKFRREEYPEEQTPYWEACRFVTHIFISIAIILSHATFIFYIAKFLFAIFGPLLGFPLWLCFFFAFVVLFFLSIYLKAFWQAYVINRNSESAIGVRFGNIWKMNSGQTADFYLNRSPNLEIYSLTWTNYSLLIAFDFIELFLYFLPMLLLDGSDSPYYNDMVNLFIVSLVLGFLGSMITRGLSKNEEYNDI